VLYELVPIFSFRLGSISRCHPLEVSHFLILSFSGWVVEIYVYVTEPRHFHPHDRSVSLHIHQLKTRMFRGNAPEMQS